MSITMEYLDGLEFEVVKQKYYNANKVNAKLEELKAGVAELIAENEALSRSGSGEGAATAQLQARLAALTAENARLTEEVTALRAENTQLTEDYSAVAGEMERLRTGISDEDRGAIVAAGNELIAAAEETADAVVADAEARAERIVGAAQAEAKRILNEAKNSPVNAPAAGALTMAQLDLIEELNSQLDSLKTTQEIQIFKLKQKLMSLAID